MTLTPTALRMLRTLPAWYWGNEDVERLLQAIANEVDRMDALIDACILGVIPGAADDEYGFLSAWERALKLPVAAPGVDVADRQAGVRAQFRMLDVVEAAKVLALLQSVVSAAVTVTRNTPGNLQDTVELDVAPGSFAAGRGEETARRVWPAHRQPIISFTG